MNLQMIKYVKYIPLLLLILNGCSKIRIENSRRYYDRHSAEIYDLIDTYNMIKQKQDFAFGYMNSNYKQYAVQVYSDSVRYIYKSHIKRENIFDEMKNIQLTREDIQKVSTKLKAAEALWIDTKDLYLSGIQQKATSISFKAVRTNMPFTSTRFYVIISLDDKSSIALTDKELNEYGLYHIAPSIYQTISSKFR